MPRPFARTGAIGNFFFIAQWFPKLGVLEEQGWNCHQFHSSTEFFSDYGVYDVRLTVPRGWTVGATGVQRDASDNADRTTTHRYYQEDVHDFAWTTSPAYVERTARFEHPALPAVALRLLLQPEHGGQADRHFNAARTALKHYGEWFGPYPYGHLTIVDPAYQSDADGMEYPTLITAGTRWLLPREVTYSGPEEVVIHEAGHQWWYGIVGNNEFEDAWLDEGINTFATARAMEQDYPRTYYERYFFGDFVPWVFRDVVASAGNRLEPAPGIPAGRQERCPLRSGLSFQPRDGTLHHVQQDRVVAEHAGAPARLGDAATHSPDVLFALAVQASEAGGLLRRRQRSRRYQPRLVLRPGVSELERLRLRRSGSQERRGRPPVPDNRRRAPLRRSDLPGRRGRHLQGRQRRSGSTGTAAAGGTGTRYAGESQALSAQVDPERVLLLDVDYTNNSKSLAPHGRSAATKWSLKWMIWLQDALLSWAFLV